jgi:predicted nucleotidyltransferase
MEDTIQIRSQNVRTTSPELLKVVERAAKMLKAAGAEAVFLFGSVGEGSSSVISDIDLAVTGLPTNKFFQILGEIMLLSPRPIDLIDLDSDTPFTRYLKLKGKLYRVA